MNVICSKNLMNVLNYINAQSKSTNKVQSMCQDTVIEAKVPEKTPKAMKQPLPCCLRCQRAHKTRRSFKAYHKRCQRPQLTTQNSP